MGRPVTDELPPEWKSVAVHVRWPSPDLERTYLPGGTIVLTDHRGREMIRCDVVADDLVDDLEKPTDDLDRLD